MTSDADIGRIIAQLEADVLEASGVGELDQVDMALEYERHRREMTGLPDEEAVAKIREWVDAHPDWRLYRAAWDKARHG